MCIISSITINFSTIISTKVPCLVFGTCTWEKFIFCLNIIQVKPHVQVLSVEMTLILLFFYICTYKLYFYCFNNISFNTHSPSCFNIPHTVYPCQSVTSSPIIHFEGCVLLLLITLHHTSVHFQLLLFVSGLLLLRRRSVS